MRKQAADDSSLQAIVNNLPDGKEDDRAALVVTNASLVLDNQELQDKAAKRDGWLEAQETASARYAEGYGTAISRDVFCITPRSRVF